MEHILLQTPDGFDLDSNYYKGTNGIGIVFCHGLRWYKEGEEPFVKAAEKLHEKGFSTLLFDFRGHGKSSGDSAEDFTITGQLTDIDVAVQFLKDEGCQTIYLAGASFGASAAVLYATSHPEITRLLLSNPALDYDRTVTKHFAPQLHLLESQGFIESGSKKFRLGKKLFEELQQFTPYKELEKYKGDLFIVHGDKDQRVAHQPVVEIFEKLTNPRKKFSLILGADHGFHEEPYTTQVAENIINFFTS
ncbi:MAG TPA: alpha/beta fold hydrolase [Patescibacteria group bacterium]|nr:alpha/beta fold hydrolase [Patescibacteria group bacterium]